MERPIFTATELYAIRLAAADSYFQIKNDLDYPKGIDERMRKYMESCKANYAGIVGKCNKALVGIYNEIELN